MRKARASAKARPSPASLREMPEIDFSRYRICRNRFARRVAREGIELVHDGPSRASLRAIPEADFGKVVVRPNPYARRIEAAGISFQVGRRRPSRHDEIGPTVTRSVRLPPSAWTRLEKHARARGITVHALIRLAIADLLRGAA